MARKKKAKPKRSKKKRTPKKIPEIKPDQILLGSRQIFLNGVIDSNSAGNIIKQLRALDKLEDSPIVLWINSGGGSITNGLAIIDTIKIIKSGVITIINGIAASMAGIISVCGDKRFITENSIWMAHDGTTGGIDYFEKLYDRTDYIRNLQKQLLTILRNKTKLSERELTKARHGELWLFAEDCEKKGIVDAIIK